MNIFHIGCSCYSSFFSLHIPGQACNPNLYTKVWYSNVYIYEKCLGPIYLMYYLSTGTITFFWIWTWFTGLLLIDVVVGGDDRRILVWNMSKALTSLATHKVPIKMDAQHNSNIFCLAFNTTDSSIISGGNDGCVIVHDIGRYEIGIDLKNIGQIGPMSYII